MPVRLRQYRTIIPISFEPSKEEILKWQIS
jgi:hypothetical protein